MIKICNESKSKLILFVDKIVLRDKRDFFLRPKRSFELLSRHSAAGKLLSIWPTAQIAFVLDY